jgi:broad specificity phosphatase PhoE
VTELALVRHGQSELNVRGALVGRSDPSLTELGRAQAAAAGRFLLLEWGRAPSSEVTVLTSPLERARNTADIIVETFLEAGLAVGPVTVEERLLELDYGEYDGLLPADLDTETWAAWRRGRSFRPPGGESLAELQSRCEGLFDEMQTRALLDANVGRIVAVSHVSPIKAAVAWALGTGPEVSWRLHLSVGAVTRVRLGGGGPAVLSFGERPSLDFG